MTIPTVRLASGYDMPQLGLGTWQLTGSSCEKAVRTALDLGYSHIDTAEMYGNHKEIGRALSKLKRNKGDARETLFITSKISHSNLTHDMVRQRFDRALDELQIEYLDLLLIHWPNEAVPLEETLGAFSELVDAGKVRSIGVSNFIRSKVKRAVELADKPIVTNQVENHPYLNQTELVDFCAEHDVRITAYSPLARGKIFQDSRITKLAAEVDKTPAQVVLRRQIQRGLIVIPKARSESHLKDNMALFDWELTPAEMKRLEAIEADDHERLINPGFAHFSEDDD